MLLFAAVALAVAYLSFAGTMRALYRDKAPATALRFGEDPIARAQQAETELLSAIQQGGASPQLLDRLDESMRRVLAEQTVNPLAFRILGSVVELRSGISNARPLMEMAEILSKRDVSTQLWLVEERVGANDIPGALRHYDIALTVEPESNAILYPLLSNAISEDAIRAALIPYLRIGRPWVRPFLEYAGGNGDVVAVAELLVAARPSKLLDDEPTIGSTILGRLVQAGQFATARTLFLTLPGADRRILSSTMFDSAASDARFQPLTWAPDTKTNTQMFFQNTADAAQMVISADPYVRGVAAQKVLFLAPGNYRIDAAYQWSSPVPGASATLILGCGQANEALASRLPLAVGSSRANAMFMVPPECDGQMLRVEIIGGETGTAELGIDHITLTKLPGNPG